MVEIRKTKSGNCGCFCCGKHQDGHKMHPYSVYHRADNEKRGHNDPVCSFECAKIWADIMTAFYAMRADMGVMSEHNDNEKELLKELKSSDPDTIAAYIMFYVD